MADRMPRGVIARLVHLTTDRQGLPERLEDPVTASRVAVFLDIPTNHGAQGRAVAS